MMTLKKPFDWYLYNKVSNTYVSLCYADDGSLTYVIEPKMLNNHGLPFTPTYNTSFMIDDGIDSITELLTVSGIIDDIVVVPLYYGDGFSLSWVSSMSYYNFLYYLHESTDSLAWGMR